MLRKAAALKRICGRCAPQNALSEMWESPEIMAERIKDKLSMTEQSTERINLFEMFMEARKNWLNAEKI